MKQPANKSSYKRNPHICLGTACLWVGLLELVYIVGRITNYIH